MTTNHPGATELMRHDTSHTGARMRVALESDLTALDVLRLLRGDERPFALVGSWAGGGAVIGSEPVAVAAEDDDPFVLLDRLPHVEGHEPGEVGGGWFGYLGYSLGARLERLPPAPPRRVSLPPFALAYYDHVLRRDPDGRWWFESLREADGDKRLEARLDLLRRRLSSAELASSPGYTLGPFRPRPGRRAHAAGVGWCRSYIADGDLFQANLCLRLEADFGGDPVGLFTAAAGTLAPDRGAFFMGPWGAVASVSPELFLRRTDRAVGTAPIKGTRPYTPAGRAELLASGKDRAENVMIVDLMRNDLGRTCAYGSVEVPVLAEAVAGAGVWHLVSEVTGTLAPGATDADLVRGAFPPGSVTGAPKIKAMRTISELESTAREVYTGAIGFASPLAGLELSVAIRTFELADGKAWLGAGGGITWGSDPDTEYRECLTKARPVIAAVGGVLEEDDNGGLPAPLGRPQTPTRQPRPDPARGVFETLLAVDGELVLLDAHLRRLASSAHALYGERLPPDLAATVASSTPASGTWRLRVVARPGEEVVVAHVPVDRGDVLPVEPGELRLLVLPGGLGSHKWVDRDLLGGPHEALIADLGGELLETGSGNLFLVEGDELVTPPADGRIRPGATREAVIALAGELGVPVRVEAVCTVRARAAGGLFRTSAIRGLQSVAGCEGVGRWDTSATARLLADRLRERWAARPTSSA